jgi:hypothetical protein
MMALFQDLYAVATFSLRACAVALTIESIGSGCNQYIDITQYRLRFGFSLLYTEHVVLLHGIQLNGFINCTL